MLTGQRAEANFKALCGISQVTSHLSSRWAGAQPAEINEALLYGQEPAAGGLSTPIQVALESIAQAPSRSISMDGIPAHYWQGWLVERLAAAELCRDADRRRWGREVPTCTPARLGPER